MEPSYLAKNPKVVLSKEDAAFVQIGERLSDQKFETKQRSFFQDALRRFAQNKGSVVAFIVIAFLFCFSIFTPIFSGYTASSGDQYYAYALPKNSLFEGTGFWDGTKSKKVAIQEYVLSYESGQVQGKAVKVNKDDTNLNSYYKIRFDTYAKGFVYKSFTASEYRAVVDFDEKQTEDSKKILAPLVDYETYCETAFASKPFLIDLIETYYKQNANYSYELTSKYQPRYIKEDGSYVNTNAGEDAVIGEKGEILVKHIYKTDENGNYVYVETSGSGDLISYQCRINYDNYYAMEHGHKPLYVLGSDSRGRDIMTRLAIGGRVSLLLGLVVSALNFIIGSIYGSIEGYYGGAADLVMERISEILSEVPTTIIFVLFNWYLRDKMNPILMLFLAFVATGWLGTASTVRMQFYRYKGQEYVLAARTLGASDARLIFKHIYPNSLGTVVTSSVLMIPSVIFSESSLSYLHIIDLESGSSNLTSIGTMLSDGQGSFTSYPNLILWPAIFISLLMICFNVFGNGLRDAFNPTLRGSGE